MQFLIEYLSRMRIPIKVSFPEPRLKPGLRPDFEYPALSNGSNLGALIYLRKDAANAGTIEGQRHVARGSAGVVLAIRIGTRY